MALTRISTDGIKDGTITGTDLATNVDLIDNKKIRFGTGNDLEIYHNGTASFISNTTGDLKIDSDNIKVRQSNGNAFIKCQSTAVELYYADNKKFETTSTGITVSGSDTTGSVIQGDFRLKTASGTQHIVYDASNSRMNFADSISATFGDANDLQIYHEGSGPYSVIRQNDGPLYIQTDDTTNGVTLNTYSGGETLAKFIKNGAVELYYDNSKKFETTSGGVLIANGNISSVPAGNGTASGVSLDTTGGDIFTGRVFIQGANKIADSDFLTGVNNNGSQIVLYDYSNSEHLQKWNKNGSTELNYNGSKKFETTSGGVTVQGTVTETSDIALKSDIQPITNSLEKIQQITGYKYTLDSSISKSMGVIAQDVEKVFPELVHGSEGNKTLQYSGLIGVLIEAVKDLSTQVAALKAS